MSSHKRIKFLPASSSHNQRSEVVSNCRPKTTVSGEEVREFYESVTGNSSNHSRKEEKVVTRTQKIEQCTSPERHQKQFKRNDRLANNILLKLAQEGDLRGLQKLVKGGQVEDINAVDGFQWTALMCASCSGHVDVVKYLLHCGANKELTNSKGETAFHLAKLKSCKRVMRVLESWKLGTDTDACESGKRLSEKNVGHRKKFFCVVCARTFKDTTPSEHRTSTVHLFNKKPKQNGTWYHLNENNKGFQMLLKDGWNKEKGLGPEGKEGLKFPVKTVLKRDRKCLGLSKGDEPVPRVTHFKAFDQSAVKKPKAADGKNERGFRATTISKRNRRKKEQKEKEWEMDFRRSFNLE